MPTHREVIEQLCAERDALAAEVERLQHHIAVQQKVFYDFARDLQDNGQYELARTVLTLLLVENVDLDDTTRED